MAGRMPQHMLEKCYKGEFVPCQYIHKHSCEMSALIKFFRVFDKAYKMYIPIHLLPALIFKWKRLSKEPVKILKKVLKNIIMSSLFLAVYVSSFHYFICRGIRFRQKTDVKNIVFASFICSFATLFEPTSRRVELSLFMFPRFLESIHLALEKRGYAKSYNNFEVILFSMAMSVMMYCYQNEESNIKSSYLSMFKKFFKTN